MGRPFQRERFSTADDFIEARVESAVAVRSAIGPAGWWFRLAGFGARRLRAPGVSALLRNTLLYVLATEVLFGEQPIVRAAK